MKNALPRLGEKVVVRPARDGLLAPHENQTPGKPLRCYVAGSRVRVTPYVRGLLRTGDLVVVAPEPAPKAAPKPKSKPMPAENHESAADKGE